MKINSNILLIVIIIICYRANTRYENLKKEKDLIESQLQKCDQAYKAHLLIIEKLETENIGWNNHVVRMQHIVGVKNPDTIFTWREKVIHPIDTKKTLEYKVN